MTDHIPTHWEIDDTHPQYHDDLIVGLSGLVDLEIGLSFIELGLVRDISLKDGEAKVTMILTTPFCPYGPEMIADCKKVVERILEVPTTVELGAQMWDPKMMDPELQDTDGWGLFG